MARKFRIGDEVEVIKQIGDIPFLPNFSRKCRGTVIDYNESDEEYPYCVKRKKTGDESIFAAKELKLVRRGKK